ncbi:MAG: TIGR00725 family protein [Chloroflexi bacterium]|nr:TIGR00725 family protein [Chloroflexota bacterium]
MSTILDTNGRPLIIAVIGGGEPPQRAMELAEEVGRELASAGVVVACGGLGGVMEAVCRGAKGAGGTTIGILPGEDPAEASAYVDLPIMTGMGYARNVVLVKTGRAVIAIDGAYGTLSEIGHALGDGTPVIGLETWDLPQRDDLALHIEVADSPADAVRRAIAAAHERDVRRAPKAR